MDTFKVINQLHKPEEILSNPFVHINTLLQGHLPSDLIIQRVQCRFEDRKGIKGPVGITKDSEPYMQQLLMLVIWGVQDKIENCFHEFLSGFATHRNRHVT